ncbi:MAG: hypothetical protein E4H14_05060 [Candidatus Thorarchaeota archaeon]|nr:MAG: hypothetical protein E4H14_05060 [Candidatus Thorarchaeota archaeon]
MDEHEAPITYFMNEEEIVLDLLLYKLSEDDKKKLRGLPEEDIQALHTDLGKALREHYRLVDQDNPYVVPGNSYHINYPDRMSLRVIFRAWVRLTGKPLSETTHNLIYNITPTPDPGSYAF